MEAQLTASIKAHGSSQNLIKTMTNEEAVGEMLLGTVDIATNTTFLPPSPVFYTDKGADADLILSINVATNTATTAEQNHPRKLSTAVDAPPEYAPVTAPVAVHTPKVVTPAEATSLVGDTTAVTAARSRDALRSFTRASTGPGSVSLKDSQNVKKYDAIIIGMGAAGCAAASELCKAGGNVLGLEAMDRVGGRIHSVPLGNGVVELGAEWIHGECKSSVFELATQARIPIDPQYMSFQVFRSDGSSADTDTINELINFALAAVDSPPKTPEPLGEYLSRRILDYMAKFHPDMSKEPEFVRQFLKFMDLVIDNYESSSSWNEVTTHSKYEDLTGEMHLSWGTSGYVTLFDILLNKIDGNIGHRTLELKLNKVVSQIKYPCDTMDNVVVTCEDGSEYVGRCAIVTVSLGVLKERYATMFVPPLPEYKIAAIDNISFGVVDKIILHFPYAWWPDDVTFFGFLWNEKDLYYMMDGGEWVTRIFGASVVKGTDNALTLWTSGRTAKVVEQLPEDVVRRKVMQLLRKFMGKNRAIPEATTVLRSSWYSNRHIRGSYTFDNLQTPLYPDARAHLAEPMQDNSGTPRLLFAGEATDPIHFSTVHGAIDSGKREAKRIILTLPKSKNKSLKSIICKGKL